MTKLEHIAEVVQSLSPEELAKFCAWFEEFQERQFDEAIERDARSGKLDKIIAEARANYRAGRREKL